MMTLSYGLRIGSVRGFGFDLLSIANNTLQITFHDRGLAKGRTCVALSPGVTFPLRADFVTDLGQQFADADQVLALDFERLVLERPAGAASGFEPIKQRGEVGLVGRQAADYGDRFSFFPRLGGERRRLLLWRLVFLRRWRALAIGLQCSASLAPRGPIPRGPFEKSHSVHSLPIQPRGDAAPTTKS